jgi:glycosyltransferase involved in cell wall biosynthesis
MKPTVALIINTADRPDYLSRVLRAVGNQTDSPDEIIIAEDGEGAETRELVCQWSLQQHTCCRHLTQEKEGFRRSRILNRAIARAGAGYIVFLDGDTIPHPDFVRDHRSLARPGFFIQGHRVLVRQRGSRWFGRGNFDQDRRQALFGGQLMGWKHVFRWLAPFKRVLRHLDGVRGCNLGIWRADLVRVNGYDESYVGWGCEDLDLAMRLIRTGTLRLDVRGRGLCYHLWHPPADRSNLAANQKRLDEVARGNANRCTAGLDHHFTAAPANIGSMVPGPQEQAEEQPSGAAA